jgi:transcriptional regulator with XRE-family HTH domain
LAGLAGLSVDYLIRLEQGRATNPSPQVLGALAQALRLSTDERDMFYRIGGSAPPASGWVPNFVSPGIQRMIDRLEDAAVGVFTAAWDMIEWNALWAALQGDPSPWTGRERNLIWRYFSPESTRVPRVQHGADQFESFEREMTSDLRLASARYPDDKALSELIADLLRLSKRFAELWERFEVAPQVSGRKTIEHPDLGPVTLDCEVLHVQASDLRLVVYTAEPGTPDAAALDLLRVTGLQELHP